MFYTFCRQKWEAICVLQLFLEHVLLKHNFSSKFSYLDRLITVSKSGAKLLLKPSCGHNHHMVVLKCADCRESHHRDVSVYEIFLEEFKIKGKKNFFLNTFG